MPMSGDEREKWGEMNARVAHLEKELEKLHSTREKSRGEALTWRVTWIQLLVGAILTLAITIGAGLLVAELTSAKSNDAGAPTPTPVAGA